MFAKKTMGVAVLLGLGLFWPTTASAQVTKSVVREAAEYLTKKFAKDAAGESVDTLAKRIGTLATQHGDDVVAAVKKVGPRSLSALEAAGAHGGKLARVISRHGDDALVWVAHNPKGMKLLAQHGDEAGLALAKHKAIAEPLVETYGQAGAKALVALEPQAARQLAMLADQGHLTRIGRVSELLQVLEQFGDKAMNFVYRHWKALTVGATLTAFLAQPQAFLDGTVALTDVVTDATVKPLAEGSGQALAKLGDGAGQALPTFAAGVAKETNGTMVVLVTLLVGGGVVLVAGLIGLLCVWRFWAKRWGYPSRPTLFPTQVYPPHPHRE